MYRAAAQSCGQRDDGLGACVCARVWLSGMGGEGGGRKTQVGALTYGDLRVPHAARPHTSSGTTRIHSQFTEF